MALRRAAALAAAAMLAFLALIPGAPAQYAGAQIVINMDSSASVNSTNRTQHLPLHGNLTIEKPPKVPVTVYLVTTNDAGWNTECSPNEFLFVDTFIATFTCAVTIPVRAPGGVWNITVHATCSGHGLSDDVYVNATVTVSDPPPLDRNFDKAPSPVSGAALALTVVVLAPAVAVPVALAAILIRRRRRKAAPPAQ
jgi:hypothetical protein